MAKGNVLIGAVRGKVGDVVLYVNDGKQVARARNRHPRNPKTQAQGIQRAIMASVLQMYSAAKMLLDHSFEGKANPKANYSRFMKVNCDKMRAEFEADMQRSRLSDTTARVVTPQSPYPSPWSFIVSEGSLKQNYFEVFNNGNEIFWALKTEYVDIPAKDIFKIGDIYTILLLGTEDASGYDDLTSPSTVFGFYRLTCKFEGPNDLGSYEFQDIFDIDYYNTRSLIYFDFTMPVMIRDSLDIPQTKGAIAIIRSREDSQLRSNSEFVCSTGLPWGLNCQKAIEAWSRVGTGLGRPMRILDGGDTL